MALVLKLNYALALQAANAPDSRISLTLHSGDLGTISGPAASGKTALLNAIIGLRNLRPGEIELFGDSIAGLRESRMKLFRQSIGVLLHDDILLSRHTVFDNLALPLRIGGIAGSQIAPRVTAQLAENGLLAKSRFRVSELGADERRRLSLAMIAVKYPRLVLADLRPDSYDLEIIRPGLMRLASLGAAVLLFERRDTPNGLLKAERMISRRESLLVA